MFALARVKLVFAFVPVLLSAACMSDGGGADPTKSTQSVRSAGPNKVFVFRDTGFAGSLVAMNVSVNGQKVGTLNSGKLLAFDVPRGAIALTVQSIGAGALNAPGMASFSNKGRAPRFFTVSLKQNFVGTEILLIETTQSSFLSQIQ